MSLDTQPSGPALDEWNVEETVLDSEPVEDREWPGDDRSPADHRPEPVSAAERFTSVDVLRGFALLGILAMNIVGFAWPGPAYGNPLRGAGFEGTDRAIWFFNHLVFEAKMMTIFSMLFGAGLVLMGERAAARGASLRGVYYRRVLWLLVIGAIHAYLIWDGDVLFLYAECGLVLYLFRNKTPRTLIILGVVLMMLIVPLVLGLHGGGRRHEGRDGPGRRPGQGRRDARAGSTGGSTTSGPTTSRRSSSPTRSRRPRTGTRRWRPSGEATSGSSSTAPSRC